MAERLKAQAEEVGEAMAAAADGDLTAELDEDLDNEAMVEIAESFNAMVADLEETILTIQDLAGEVNEVSVNVAASVDEIEQASRDVGGSAEETSVGTTTQKEQFQEVFSEMNSLSATIEEIASTADDVATVSEVASDTAALTESAQSLDQAVAVFEVSEGESRDAGGIRHGRGSSDDVVSVDDDASDELVEYDEESHIPVTGEE